MMLYWGRVAPVPVEHDPEEHIQPGQDLEREP